MKTKLLFAVLLVAFLMVTACTMNYPVCATSNPVGTKIGVYTQTCLLGFPPAYNKTAAIAQAAKNGGITKISTVDYKASWMVFVIKYDTIVTGE
jgi:hypothetical protein